MRHFRILISLSPRRDGERRKHQPKCRRPFGSTAILSCISKEKDAVGKAVSMTRCATPSSGASRPSAEELSDPSAASRIHPVQEPARRRLAGRRVAIKPRAEQPEAQACAVLDAEIVARAGRRSPSLHQAPSMRSGPSAATTSCSARRQRKRSGGPSGTTRDRLDRLRLGKQPQRPRGSVRPRRGSGEMPPSRARLLPSPVRARRRRQARGCGCRGRPGA